jgi:DNA-binding transcriptional regulator YiaG
MTPPLPHMSAAEIAAMRKRLNKTQAEMAVLFGVDLRTFRRWENGERSIPGPVVILSRYILNDHEKVNGFS